MRREWASRGSSEEESARKVLQLVAKLQAQQQEITRTGGMGTIARITVTVRQTRQYDEGDNDDDEDKMKLMRQYQ